MATIHIPSSRADTHYEVMLDSAPLGVGGMGQVLKGTRIDASGNRLDVAIKFLFDDLPDQVIDRARREASIQIHNENLLEMYEFIQLDEVSSNGTVHKRYHVVSELLHGVILYDFLKGKTTDCRGAHLPYIEQIGRAHV